MPGTPANIAQDFSDLAGHIGDILANPNIDLTEQQTTALNDYRKKLTALREEADRYRSLGNSKCCAKRLRPNQDSD